MDFCPFRAHALQSPYSLDSQEPISTSVRLHHRVRHLLSDADIEELFHTQLSDVTKATILRHLEDDVHVRNGRSSSISSPCRPTPPPLLLATKSPSKYAIQNVHAAAVVPASSPPSTKIVKRRLESPSDYSEPTTSAKKNRH
jgi:hypothetical protein